MDASRKNLSKTGHVPPGLFVRRRPARQPFRLASTRWPWFMLPGAALVLLCMAVLDGPVAFARDAMSSRFQAVAARLTDLSTAPWILTVTGIVILAALVAISLSSNPRFRFRAALVAHQGLYLFCALALASASANLVKNILGRARPVLFESVGDLHFSFGAWAYDYASFPSGHSTAAGAVFAALALLYPRCGPLFAALALFFGFARIAIGAHYPSDVTAGLLYGAWISVLMACLFARYRLLFVIPERGLPKRRRVGRNRV